MITATFSLDEATVSQLHRTAANEQVASRTGLDAEDLGTTVTVLGGRRR